MYALYLYFLGLSFRNTAKALDIFVEKRSHVAVWNWVRLFHPNKFYLKRTRVTAFIIDETMLQIGSDYAWLWLFLLLHVLIYMKPQIYLDSSYCRP
jgi:hypothetical protein